MKPLIIYHANCPDGFGAAWSFWKKYGKNAEYYPAIHGESPPDVTGREVYIADFSYSREITEEIAEKSKKLIILDHHKTALQNLEGLHYFRYDVTHSGAYLAWRYLFGEQNVPNMILMIEDRDLWNWKLLDSKLLLTVLDSYPYDFEVWDMLSAKMELESSSYSRLLMDGMAINRYKESVTKVILQTSHKLKILGLNIDAINSPYFQSELGATLCLGKPYACVYSWDGDQYRFSLRSDPNGLDVAEIAKTFGGGGHAKAAGFTVPSLEVLNESADNQQAKLQKSDSNNSAKSKKTRSL
jgi:oligoribonuclease NrnB/cAMP/cGMP phosphodiesterase (DHH superfamily)